MSEDFVKVAVTKDIPPSQMKAVEVSGEKICVVNVGGKYYAIGNVCTHVGGPLAEGTLEGYEVECPWHGSATVKESRIPNLSALIKALSLGRRNRASFCTDWANCVTMVAAFDQ